MSGSSGNGDARADTNRVEAPPLAVPDFGAVARRLLWEMAELGSKGDSVWVLADALQAAWMRDTVRLVSRATAAELRSGTQT